MDTEVESAVPPRRLITRVRDREAGYEETWTYELSSDDRGGTDGTRLTITERRTVRQSFLRTLSPFDTRQRRISRFMTELGRRFDESVTVERLS